MKLDFTDKGFFTLHAAHGETLHAAHGEIEPQEIIAGHGLQYSLAASCSRGEHVLYADEPLCGGRIIYRCHPRRSGTTGGFAWQNIIK